MLGVKEQSLGPPLDFGQAIFVSCNAEVRMLQDPAAASTDDRKRMGTLTDHCKTHTCRHLCSRLPEDAAALFPNLLQVDLLAELQPYPCRLGVWET